MQIIQDFMKVYMYELELFLNSKKKEIKSVQFQSDEANTDRPLKEYLKKVIEDSFTCIPSSSQVSSIEFEGHKSTDVNILKTIRISKVLLPEDITDSIKDIIKESKNAVYTNPDMCLEIIYNGEIYYETIELKSTKQDAIPGSSIQQILPEEWVIFIKHSGNDIAIATGQYIHAVNSKMQFPDRSPRPQVSFKELFEWNRTNRLLQSALLIYKKADDEQVKYDLIEDWQGVLSNRWIDMLFNSSSVRNNEPWFNNSMRKFIISFLDKYESLPDSDKEKLKEKIKSLIKDE